MSASPFPFVAISGTAVGEETPSSGRSPAKKRVLADFVLDVRLQLERRQLQKLDGLPQLRRDDELLGLTRLKP